MKILFDHCTPQGLKEYLQEHEVRTAKDEDLHEVRNGELIKAAVDRGFDVLITADKRMRKQERISGLPLRVVVLTRPYWPSVKPHAERIRRAVEGAEPGRFTTVRTARTDTVDQSAERTADAQKPGRPAGISGGQEQGKGRLRQGRIVFHKRSDGRFDIKHEDDSDGTTKTLTSCESIRSGLKWLARKKLVAESEVPRLERNLLEELKRGKTRGSSR